MVSIGWYLRRLKVVRGIGSCPWDLTWTPEVCRIMAFWAFVEVGASLLRTFSGPGSMELPLAYCLGGRLGLSQEVVDTVLGAFLGAGNFPNFMRFEPTTPIIVVEGPNIVVDTPFRS